MAWYDVRPLGTGVNRAFGETEDERDDLARRRHREWAQYAVRLALARTHFELLRGESDQRWRRRLRASLRLKDVRKLITHLPNLGMGTATRYPNLIYELIRRASAINAQEVVAEVSAPHVHPSHRLYVLAPRLNPSMPNLHFRWLETDNVLELNGQAVPYDERALRAIGAMLPRLTRRIRAQDVPAELVYSSLTGTYAEKAMRTLFPAITFGQGEPDHPVRTTAMAISTVGMAPILRRWAIRNASFVAVSILLDEDEAAAKSATADDRVKRQRLPFENAPPYKMLSRRAASKALAQDARRRWERAYEADPTLPPPASVEDTAEEIERVLEEQGDCCAECGCALSLLKRRLRFRVAQIVAESSAVGEAAGDEANAGRADEDVEMGGESGVGAMEGAEMVGQAGEEAREGEGDRAPVVVSERAMRQAESMDLDGDGEEMAAANVWLDDGCAASDVSEDPRGREVALEDEMDEDDDEELPRERLIEGASEPAQPLAPGGPATAAQMHWPTDRVIGTVGNTKYQPHR